MTQATQIQIDWTRSVHELENNKFSQKNLDKHRQKRIGQVAITKTLLEQGVNLTDEIARSAYHIKDLARRIADCGDKLGMYVDREWAVKYYEQQDYLVYFLYENRKKFIEMGRIINRPFRWWYSEKYTPTEIINEILNNKNEKK